MNKKNKQDIQNVINYLYDEELKHYEENQSKDHIIHALNRLKEVVSK